jgi:hypothetical protein
VRLVASSWADNVAGISDNGSAVVRIGIFGRGILSRDLCRRRSSITGTIADADAASPTATRDRDRTEGPRNQAAIAIEAQTRVTPDPQMREMREAIMARRLIHRKGGEAQCSHGRERAIAMPDQMRDWDRQIPARVLRIANLRKQARRLRNRNAECHFMAYQMQCVCAERSV